MRRKLFSQDILKLHNRVNNLLFLFYSSLLVPKVIFPWWWKRVSDFVWLVCFISTRNVNVQFSLSTTFCSFTCEVLRTYLVTFLSSSFFLLFLLLECRVHFGYFKSGKEKEQVKKEQTAQQRTSKLIDETSEERTFLTLLLFLFYGNNIHTRRVTMKHSLLK